MALKRLQKNYSSYSKPKAAGKAKLFSLLSTFILFAIFISIILAIAIIIYFAFRIPSPKLLTDRPQPQATKIYDRNGELLYNIFKNQNRTPIKLADVPPYMRDATISIEDRTFYTDPGFSVTGILRSLWELILTHHIQGGGSTLTQQLVKNALLSNEQTVSRKIKEFILAIEVERLYTKDQILDMYLNEIPYGGTAYGIEAAANLYFGKHAKDLDLAQSSLLAGLPQEPSVYSPYGTHPELAKVRQKEVLQSMVSNGYISQKQADDAYNEKLTYRTPQSQVGFKAPHFVLYVKQKLEEQFGTAMVEEGGLHVTTTLDYKLQEQAQNIVKNEINNLTQYHVGNGAAVILDPKTGEILAMIGSKDYFDAADDGNFNVAINPRQPGSSTKPIIYAKALEKGYTASTVLMDVQTKFPGGSGTQWYIPGDYDGTFHGPVQVRYALANSLNIPAVKMLAMVGIKDAMELGYEMGVSTWQPTQQNISNIGLSLVLGGREVKLLDLATAYSVFADEGYHHDPVSILKVTDSTGKVLYEYHPDQGQKILDPGIAFIISSILSDNGARTMAFGPNSVLVVPGKTVAVKTGTTDDKRDNWAVGYTPSYVVGVWVGNNDDTPMNQAIASGITGASPIWNKIMSAALSGKKDEPFVQPPDVVQENIDALMGGLPKDGYPNRKEYYLKGTEPTAISSAYQNRKVCSVNPHRLASPSDPGSNQDVVVLQENDPTGANQWQDGIDKWVLTSANPKFVGTAVGCSGIPGFSSGTGGVISIVNIPNGANVPKVFDVLAAVNSPNGVKSVKWQIDGQDKATQTAEPFSLHVSFPSVDKSNHTISVTLTDNTGATFTSSIQVSVALQ